MIRAAAALAALLAVSACGTPRRPPVNAIVFTPTVLGTPLTAGAYVSVEARRAGGTAAAFADVIEIVLPGEDADPLAAAPGTVPAGAVVQRTATDKKGRAGLAFPVGMPACAYVWDGGYAGAGAAMISSLVTRPENVYGYGVRLVPAVTLRGEVTDADGRPAAGATVRAAFRCGADPGLVVLMTTCNPDGDFVLPPVPAGPDDTGNAVSLRADAPDGTSVRRETTTAGLRAGPVRLVLGR
jgi:hypothetical protein